MTRPARHRLRLVVVAGVLIGAATAAVALFEHAFGIDKGSPTSLVAVVLAALLIGTVMRRRERSARRPRGTRRPELTRGDPFATVAASMCALYRFTCPA